MAAIHDDFGNIWKDTNGEIGGFTTIVEMFGISMTAYAVEVDDDDGICYPVDEGSNLWEKLMGVTDGDRNMETMSVVEMGGSKFAVFVA